MRRLFRFGECPISFSAELVGSDFFWHRCTEEDTKLSAEALSILTSMASSTTLRYALNLISCAQVSTHLLIPHLISMLIFKRQVVALKRKSPNGLVDTEDLRRCYSFFLDEKRSVQWVGEGTAGLVGEEDGQASKDRMEE